MKGTVEHIHIARVSGGPVESLDEVEATAGVGLAGDRHAGHDASGSDLTLIEGETTEWVAAEHGIGLAPGELRRNITTRGIRLEELVGRDFWIGGVLARGKKLSEPCEHLQQVVGKPILKPLVHRGGLRAELLTSGRIKLGDRIEVKP